MRAGEIFRHRTLGECRVDAIHDDGEMTVTTVNVVTYRGHPTNVFRIRRPTESPEHWQIVKAG